MAGVKISAIAADSSVTGVELIPVSDAGVAKSVTVTQIKNFTIDQIEAIPTTDTAPLTDSAFILQGEELKPVLLSVIAESVINEIWNKTLDASLAGTDIIAINNGSTTDNTATLAVLASYIQSAIRAAVLNPATLDASGATAGADYFVIGQSGVAKSITLTSLTAAIYSGMAVDEDTLASDLATKVPTQQSVKAYVDARIPQAVDGTLATGNNASVSPTKLVYNKTCSDSTGDDIITLNDGTVIGQMLTIYLGTKSGTDSAIITPATALSYTTITLDAVTEIATLQWQGATVGWAILYTNGTVA